MPAYCCTSYTVSTHLSNFVWNYIIIIIFCFSDVSYTAEAAAKSASLFEDISVIALGSERHRRQAPGANDVNDVDVTTEAPNVPTTTPNLLDYDIRHVSGVFQVLLYY